MSLGRSGSTRRTGIKRTFRHGPDANHAKVVASVTWRLHVEDAVVANLEAVRAGVHGPGRLARVERKVEVVVGTDDDGNLARVDLFFFVVVVAAAQILDVAAREDSRGSTVCGAGRARDPGTHLLGEDRGAGIRLRC